MKILKGITQSGMASTIAALAAEHDRAPRLGEASGVARVHVSLTEAVIVAASYETMFNEAMIGFCIDCGTEHNLCEPDAERFRCDECNALQVYGAEQLLLMTVS